MSNPSDFVIENGVLTKYTGPGGNVVIPEGVTSIGREAFLGCLKLTSATIPEGVTSIGNLAFGDCASLTSVIIPESVSCIGDWVFEGCSSLNNVAIPDSVTRIGNHCFDTCRSLTGVKIPDSVTCIGWNAFRDCSSLVNVAIPNGVTSIGNWAFKKCSSLKSVSIPEGVTGIGVEMFYGCSSLTNVVIPKGVTNIGDRAFYGCSSLASVTISDSVTSIGDNVFSWCSSLTSVTIPVGVKSIGKEAFSDCRSLTSVIIPTSVTSIGKCAFDGCRNLTIIISSIKLAKGIFDDAISGPVITNDPGNLPAKMKPLASIGFAENPDDPKLERGKKHLKYIKANAAKLQSEAFAHPALLNLMCENKLITPEVADAYLAAAQKTGNTEITTILLDYQQNKLTEKEKAKAAQKSETREEKVTDFVFSVKALEQLQGKVFVVTGKLNTFTSRDEFKACLDACGAILSETLNEQTNYLITNTPHSGSAKNKKAEALGVIKLSEEDFNKLIGRKQE